MDEFVRFLTACLDEDERIARAATQGDWVWSREFVTPPGYHYRTVGPLEPGDAAYIAAWNPARVLREIDTKRQIMECHEPWVADNGDTICGRCGREHIDGRPGGHFPCQTLRLLASVYRDRPGFSEEWRP